LDHTNAPEVNQLRLLILGGEKMSPAILSRWQQHMPSSLRLLNTYGPTEATVIASLFDATDFDSTQGSIPIGKPLANSRIYLRDPHGQPAPLGAYGEICIGGDGVASGYLSHDQQNKDQHSGDQQSRFVPDWSLPGQMYLSGDIARFNHGTELEFLARKDDQLKIRGFRVECTEIEVQLNRLVGVSMAVVRPFVDAHGDNQLVAYVQLQGNDHLPDETVFTQRLGTELRTRIPAYMVPVAFMVIDAIPLTNNGKVDFKQLPEANISTVVAAYEGPTTKTERMLVEIWARLLQLEQDSVSVTADFFELGGHSVLFLKLNNEIQALALTSEQVIDLKEMITTPVLKTMAHKLDLKVIAAKNKLIEAQIDDVTDYEDGMI
jgi:acyl-CoA synthetase (AMP-forming)/AMP-acid ligase II